LASDIDEAALIRLEEPFVDLDEASGGRSREYEVSFEFSCISCMKLTSLKERYKKTLTSYSHFILTLFCIFCIDAGACRGRRR
jgi:hypothetical protein